MECEVEKEFQKFQIKAHGYGFVKMAKSREIETVNHALLGPVLNMHRSGFILKTAKWKTDLRGNMQVF